MSEQGGALGRAEIAASIAEKLGISRRKAKQLTDNILDRMSQALEDGGYVKITHFGTFNLRDKPERPGRNPMTGEAYAISPRRVVVFNPSRSLRASLATPGTDQTAEN